MSQKITSKNLSYSASLPPFLQRMQAQTSNSGFPSSRPSPRPTRPRDENADAEDAPTYILDDEAGGSRTVSREEYEFMMRGQAESTEKENGEGSAKEGENEKQNQHDDDDEARREAERRNDKSQTTIGATRKRKAGRVIGAGSEDEDEDRGRGAGHGSRKTGSEQAAVKKGGEFDKTRKAFADVVASTVADVKGEAKSADASKPESGSNGKADKSESATAGTKKKKGKKIKLSFDEE